MSETKGNGKPSLISRADLLGLTERRYAICQTKLNGLSVRIRSLTDAETAEVDEKRFAGGEIDRRHAFADTAIATIVDDEGDPIFGEMDREALTQIDGSVARALHEEILQHLRSGPFAEPDEELKKS